MTRYVGLLRAVNVGGSGTLAMSDLRSLCREAGLARVSTVIASGNVVFDSASAPAIVKAELEVRLHAHTGRAIGVVLRTADQIRAVLVANPFPAADPRSTYAIFLNEAPPADALRDVVGQQDEEICLGEREIFVHYPNGMGRSRLKIPAAQGGTARNMNTVARLAAIASQ